MVKMKDSGIEWIGEVPNSWKIAPIYYCATEVNSKNQNMEAKNALKFTYGSIVNKEGFNVDEDPQLEQTLRGYVLVKKNNIIINGLNLNYDFVTQRVGRVTQNKGAITSAYIAISVNDNCVSKYFMYLLKSYDSKKAFHNMGGGVRKILNFNSLSKQKVPLPSKIEQQHIADFLDKKTGTIDATINKINDEIELLKQYQNSVITQAVTKGLDPNVPMKDSGISYIGKIPQKWRVEKIKYRSTEIGEKSKLSDLHFNYIGLENVQKHMGRFIKTDSEYVDTWYDSCIKGDILYSRLRPNLGKVLISPVNACCTGEFQVLRGHDIENKYLFYYLLSNVITRETSMAIYGAKMPRVSWHFVSNLKISFPDNSEQKKICIYLDEKCNKIYSLIKAKRQQISQLTDYKNSLIFDYVTGKKRVPEIKEMA